MAYERIDFNDLGGGLNLKDKADAVGPNECLDCKNVVFSDTGAVQSRPGYAEFTGSALTNNPDTLAPFYTSGGTRQLLAGCGTRLEALNTSGAVVASLTTLTATGAPWYWDFCRVGTASAEYAYAGNGENVLKRWDGSAWSSIANTPQGGALCVTPASNRLVVTRFKGTSGGPSGSASNPSRVFFSDQGDPETYTLNAAGAYNFIDLDPGDGEMIQAAITWREYVFVFKETKFYVFTGESTNAAGDPVFNYRKIDTGVGACAPRAVTANEDGVYFADRTGVYTTTGEAPVKLSEKIDPIFYGTSTPYSIIGNFNLAYAYVTSMAIWQGLLLTSLRLGSNVYVLVYDLRDGWWSFWILGQGANCSTFRITDLDELVFSNLSGGEVYTMRGDLTADAGASIERRWRTGFSDLGTSEVKRLRQIKFWGQGTFTVATTADFKTTATGGSTVTFSGSGYTLNPALYRAGVRGTTFGLYVTSTSTAAWAIHRMAFHIAGQRQVTVAKTDR